MVFSSIPAYLDASNWQHQQNNQIIGSSGGNPLLPPQPQPVPPPVPPHGGGGGAGSIRPGSMAERARLANIPLPETALKCPRCESSNTKFCYFNNYSLSQPRHFCKTCRRYWTRGGALRNVPVGGGCRRNKRSSKSAARSKSPGSGDSRQQTNPSSSTPSSTNAATTAAASNMLGLTPQLRFMSNLSQIPDNFSADLINYNGITTPASEMMNFHGSSNLLGGSAHTAGVASLLSSIGSSGGGGIIEPWRSHHQLQQFPFFGGLDPSPSGIFQFQGSGESGFMGGGESSHVVQVRPKLSNSELMVKMEENPDQANLSRQLLSGHDHHQWNTASTANWAELSSFSTSSTSNQL